MVRHTPGTALAAIALTACVGAAMTTPAGCGSGFAVENPEGGAARDGSLVDGPAIEGGPGDAKEPGDAPVGHVDGSGGMTDVAGTVVDLFLRPVANATVRIGPNQATSQADGTFTIPNVATPYNLFVYPPAAPHVYEFVQLTSAAPTAQLPFERGPTPSVATVNGTTGLAVGVGSALIFADLPMATAGGGNWTVSTAENTVTYSDPVSFFGGPSVEANLYALEWTNDSNGQPSSYTFWNTESKMLAGGMTTMWELAGLTGAVSTKAMTVTTTVPDDTQYVGAFLYVRPTGSAVAAPLSHSEPGPANQPSNPSTLETPDLPASFVACSRVNVPTPGLDAGSEDIPFTTSCAAGLQADATPTIAVPAPPTLTAPASGTAVSLQTSFAWSPLAGGVSLLAIEPSDASNFSYFILTPSDGAKIPSLSEAPLPTKATYTATLYGFSPFASVDDAVGSGGYYGMALSLGVNTGPAASGVFSSGGVLPLTTQ